MILLLTGFKGSGKDTVADYIVNNYDFVKYSLAEPLKFGTRILFGFSEDQMHDPTLKEVVDERYGVTPREVLQWVGTEVMQHLIGERFPIFKEKIGRNHWISRLINNYEQLKNSINREPNIVVADCRFPHESDVLKEKGYDVKVIRVIRENNLYSSNDMHPSELAHLDINPDYMIDNTGTYDDLYKEIDNIIGTPNV